MFFGPETGAWKELKPIIPIGTEPAEEQKILAAAKAAKDELKTFLLSSLQMQHVVVLAGSGTSLGPITKGPSMWTLWDYCVNKNPATGDDARTVKSAAANVIAEIGYEVGSEKENIDRPRFGSIQIALMKGPPLLQIHPRILNDPGQRDVRGLLSFVVGLAELRPTEERQQQKARDDAFRKEMKQEKERLAKADYTFKPHYLGLPPPPKIRAPKKEGEEDDDFDFCLLYTSDAADE